MMKPPPGFLSAVVFVAIVVLALPAPLAAQSVIEEWSTVQAPPPPTLSKVTVDPQTTALLVLDLTRQTCNAERRPRCIAMLPRVRTLLDTARAKGLFIVYTLGGASTPTDILPEVAMTGGEPVISSGPDKYLETALEQMLTSRGITTVIVVGAVANGAVLHTAAGAAFRGLKVIVPVDGMAAETAYAEQYTAWDLANAPRLADKVTLTKTDMID
jgi:nicotinamidase-related amidase